jgi:transcriptional regulator GlxA family with amidase domain
MLERPVSGDIGLTPLLDLSTASGQMHASLLHAIAFGLSNGGPLTRSPIALSLLTESLVRLLLETVPHRFSVTLARKPALVAPWHVKQAKEFMHQNMHRPLKASDIAEACGTGVRSLEAGFRAFQNMALMAYLRRIRLEAVHAELTRPDNLQPVAEIALRWGFAHLGRFSAYYRMAYGELPSETVARKGGHKRC